MQYMGGKTRSARRIVETLKLWRQPEQVFYDIFCGALNIVRHMGSPRVAVDACEPLIVMWQALQAGWNPPYITRNVYDQIKSVRNPHDPRTALALFGCSYGGVWARSYAKPRPEQDYPACARNQALAKSHDCLDVKYVLADYREVSGVAGQLVYADPPWAGVGGRYPHVGEFSPSEFWEHALTWGPYVFVSEGAGAAPGSAWVVYDEWSVDGTIGARPSGHRTKQVERLYVPSDSPMAGLARRKT